MPILLARPLFPFLALALLVGCRAIQPIDPDPIDVASSGDRTDAAIHDALRRDGWEVETWGPGEIYARTSLEGESLRIRIALDEASVRIGWIEGPSDESDPEEVADRRRQVRRMLRSLAERIEYFIASADLEPAPAPAPTPGTR